MKKYELVYNQIVAAINRGEYGYHERIPSIRETAQTFNLSKTTVENAYNQLLVEGYIISREKSGFFVDVKINSNLQNLPSSDSEQDGLKEYKYDFSGLKVDGETFKLDIWRKYLKNTLQDSESLLSYGNNAGEIKLRRALSKYCFKNRGINAGYSYFYIGSGFQNLMQLICTLFPKDIKVGIETNGFSQAITVFKDMNLDLVYLPVDNQGPTIAGIKESGVKLLYLNSSSGGYHGSLIKMQRRLELVAYASEHQIYIIEDDHNGELKYLSKPVDAMRKLDNQYLIYLGSFSKLLLPSLRIAYAIIPETLKTAMDNKVASYHQTVSKIDQITLANYIEDGQLERHLKRLRKHYNQKARLMMKELKKYFPDTEAILYETALKIALVLKEKEIDEYIELADKNKILITKNSNNQIALSFSGIKEKDISSAIQLLSKIWL